MTCHHPAKLHVKRTVLCNLSVESYLLTAICGLQAWDLNVEEVFGGVVSKFISQVTFTILDFNEPQGSALTLTHAMSSLVRLPLKCLEQLPHSCFEVHVRRQSNHLHVHVCSLRKLKWHVSFEEKVVHAFVDRQVVDKSFLHIEILFLLFFIQLNRVRDVLLRHYQEVLVGNWPLRQRRVEVLGSGVEDEFLLDSRVIETEPTVFVLLLLRPFHLKVDLQTTAQKSRVLRLLNTLISSFLSLKLDHHIRLMQFTSFLLLRILRCASEVGERLDLSKLLKERLDLFLGHMLVKATQINQVAVSLVDPCFTFCLLFLDHGLLQLAPLFSFE